MADLNKHYMAIVDDEGNENEVTSNMIDEWLTRCSLMSDLHADSLVGQPFFQPPQRAEG